MKWDSRNLFRRTGRRRLIGSIVALAVLAVGYYGFRLQYPASRVGRACGGMLPVDSVLDLAGKSKLSLLGLGFDVSSRQFDVSDDVTEPVGLAARCSVDGAEISIETSAGVHNAYAAFQLSQESPVVPLNAGWQGFIAPGGGSGATALVLLSCENWSAKEGSGILVMADPPAGAKVTESTRLQLARVATGTARRAAQKTGCATETKEEGKAGELTAPAATAKTVPAGNATGTCKGMTSAKTVRETAAGVSPVEECLLVGGLQLTAAYGPFSNSSDAVVDGEYGGHDSPSGVERSTAWTSAACQGALGVGYYRASPVEGSDREFSADPLTKEERQDLEHFAEQSAARHACSTPKALPR